MKKIIISALTIFMLISTSGCQDWLDVNHDPNVLEEIPDSKVLLPVAEVGLANNLMGWDIGFAGGFWSEYWTQTYTASQFKFLCEYNETGFNTAYNSLTAGVLADLDKIKKLSLESQSKGNYYVAEALSIFTWQIITDLWGNVPYSEALKGSEGISSPKFDKGEDIYADLLKRVEELLKVDLSGAMVTSEYDFIYAGELEQWKLFANSLKLKLMLRLSETPQYDNAKTLAFVKANRFLAKSAKIAGSVWVDGQEGKRHPMREFEAGEANYLSTNVIACKNFIDYLRNNNDPRISQLFTFSDPKAGTYRGAFFGDFDSKVASDGSTTDNKVAYSKIKFAPDMDLMIMSDWEVSFYIAEVYARAGDQAKAKEFYEKGVKASLQQHGITETNIVEGEGYAVWKGGEQEEMIEQIGMQKWVANAHYQHVESFLERNRTKYPAIYDIDIKLKRQKAYSDPLLIGHLTISVNGRAKLNGGLPVSPLYPDAVMTRNENKPDQKADLKEKVWWDKKAEIRIPEQTNGNN
ncbi:hypothetical protein IX307_002561 [Bacteroides pyogenes]|uniref:SusD/RagB family nutrient-binding outer membrane lipoprotein n=1 Tax=Bacteroides pyogenes TaxID=310300 RepID=UPI001BAC70F8|nr:SusD/RagB family nutrient-binding outer membrane lipoprotein [Bacteroides pyogenes]MBR8721369.1 hypothetical protein [Bacteroides pyogenes]MBR8726556.1 hypothetical protein [Bacteroides pyogenes]MBR8739920.1 hypothetical protein [Bacteroides pyogenes]MBR8755702.1 hypothetical protein [Bacteroides pyogenes]MBR8788215.1 hypothetical protein [Bacteroides pyogenes]